MTTATTTRRRTAAPKAAEQAERAADNADATEARRRAEDPTRTAPARRARGVLDAEILAYLATRPTDDLGPYEVAKAISAKTGGVHPSLERLLAKGLVVKTSTVKPVRYRLAAAPKAKAAPRKRATAAKK
jgi:hypothetical protein